MVKTNAKKHRGAVRVSASAGPPPRAMSYAHQVQQANTNAQPAVYTYGSSPPGALSSTPSTKCVRAPYDEWYATQSECLTKLPKGLQCNPRYINGVWDRYTPYARDSTACGGPLPADVLPQVLDATSLIETEIARYVDHVKLALSTNNVVGRLTFTYADAESGNPEEVVEIVWMPSNNVNATLFNPVEYVYAVPFGTGIARLTINTLSGHATVRFPFKQFLAKLQFQITNIQNWQETQAMRTPGARSMSESQIG